MSRRIELPETARKSPKGFSLIELLFVVAIIGIIAAIAIPALARARKAANASSAIQTLRTIVTAEHLYEIKNKSYGSLSDIGGEEAIDSVLASGSKSGYTFTLTVSPDGKKYACTATPQDQPEALDHFFVDETGVIRYNTGAPADPNSQPIPR
ncbi:MAG TPA: prepilin-type N-terminal cleavage/methylation domain-containing protein [Blastocatellia bacterium]|nr:prepilin-type N-terminal cleavage/methylation domain-containing protein [Blastocatellia bacterium]